MAEAHPVGFRWVMKAKERGARVIHVDPRYGRTSQMADLYVPVRAGTDVAFLGGIIRHVIETASYFKEYVVNYTNACAIVDESFRDTEELDGVFSGYDPETGAYDPISWMYRGCRVNFSAGPREHATEPFSEHTGAGMLVAVSSTTRRSSTRGVSFRSCAGTSPAARRRWCSVSVGSHARSSWQWRMR
jgi:formate dehydrogenase major subunit